ncbi:hypothetical protein [Streptomyces rubiginosohelvolus]|uniref:hypothetical protein n=1 Tax=Streptomyces rubiginosohelvolus TaxID=67362 RepID=UPI0035D6705B
MNPNILNLRCQTVIDGELGYVLVPVERMLWETDEHSHEALRMIARKELRHSAMKRAGRNLPAADFENLPVWVEYPDRCEIECVGGPHDGQRVQISAPEPPCDGLQLPVEEDPATLADARLLESRLQIATYVPLTGDGGFLSRTEDGAWRYRFSS